MAKDIPWVKLYVDLFDNTKVKIILAQHNGFRIFFIWIALLCLAGQQNNDGKFELVGKDMTTDQLAIAVNVSSKSMKEAVDCFIQLNMLVRDGDTISIKNWKKYQTIKSKKEYKKLTKKKEEEKNKEEKNKEEKNKEENNEEESLKESFEESIKKISEEPFGFGDEEESNGLKEFLAKI